MTNWEELKWRGLIKDTAGDDIEEKINKGGMTFYIGTDPTADSLHLGHYSSFMTAKRLMLMGHHPIILCGAAFFAARTVMRQVSLRIFFPCL